MSRTKSGRAKRRELERELAKRQSTKNVSNKELFYTLKYVLNETQAQTLLKSISKDKLNEIKSNGLPKNYSDLRKLEINKPIDNFIKEICWYTKEIEEYKDEINNFLFLENSLEKNFLSGNYTQANLILNKIEKEICVSQWSIEKRLLIAEYEVGFKKNKEILSDIINIENHPLTNLLSKYQSIKVEKNLSFFKYEEIMLTLLEAYPDRKVKELLNFKLNFFGQGIYQHKGFILNIENSSSIIDRYKSYIHCILLYVSESHSDETIDKVLKENLFNLQLKIKDNRITNILYSLGEIPDIKINDENKEFFKILDLYTSGKYDLVIKLLETFILKNPNVFELYELLIKSNLNLKKQFNNPFPIVSFSGKCLNDLYNIFSKNSETHNSFINSMKTYNSIGNIPWSYSYFALFHYEHALNFENFNINKYSHLNCSFLNPSFSLYLKNYETGKTYLDNIRVPESVITSKFYEQILQIINGNEVNINDKEIEPFRRNIYHAQALQASGKYEAALEKYQNILNSPELTYNTELNHNKIEIIQGILNCLLNLSRFKEAVNLVALQNISNPNFNQRLRSDYLLRKLTQSEDEDLMREISTSIVLHQYQSYVNPNDLWIAYDNFLSIHNLNYPKEIESILGNTNELQAIYFLRNISKQEIFDSSYLFENQDELDNERIEICSLLTKIDKNNFEEYINEISEINRNILIRKGIKQMDESKIYVDVKGIKKSLEKDIKESFDRSMNLLNLSLDQIRKLDLDSDPVITPYYGKSPEIDKIEFKESNLKITSYSRFKQFTDMFYKIRDKFIASNEFGIDTYLSMRIRHGTLLGEIRSVYEKYYLITKKQDNSTIYKENIYWQKLISKSEKEICQSFNSLMAAFSKEIDSISDDLKNYKLQIRTEKKESVGVFDYTYEHNHLLELFQNRIGAIDNFQDFFDEIILILWERTENNLAKIRIDISENIKSKMVGLLVNLLKDIETLFDKNENPEVNEIIRNITSCQTDIKNELDKIAAWFKRTNSKTINEFYIQLPIDSTLTTLKRLFKDYQNLSPILNIFCNIKFEGENFPHFCYIFQNLMHNIIEHAKLDCNELVVKINISESNNNLIIKIENNFSNSIDLEELNNEIESTKLQLLQSHDNDKIRAEKGTGYLKIQKTLISDLIRDSFEIKIRPVNDDRIFMTEINFNLNNLQKQEQYESIIN